MEPQQPPVPDREEATAAGLDPEGSQPLQTEAQKNYQEVVKRLGDFLGSPRAFTAEELEAMAQEADAPSLDEAAKERTAILRKDSLFKTHDRGKSSNPKKKPLHEKKSTQKQLRVEGGGAFDPPSDLFSETSSSITNDPEHHTAAPAVAIEQEEQQPEKEKEGGEESVMIPEEEETSQQEIAAASGLATGVNNEINMTQAASSADDFDRVRRIVEPTPISDERLRKEHPVEEEEEERKIPVVLPPPVMRMMDENKEQIRNAANTSDLLNPSQQQRQADNIKGGEEFPLSMTEIVSSKIFEQLQQQQPQPSPPSLQRRNQPLPEKSNTGQANAKTNAASAALGNLDDDTIDQGVGKMLHDGLTTIIERLSSNFSKSQQESTTTRTVLGGAEIEMGRRGEGAANTGNNSNNSDKVLFSTLLNSSPLKRGITWLQPTPELKTFSDSQKLYTTLKDENMHTQFINIAAALLNLLNSNVSPTAWNTLIEFLDKRFDNPDLQPYIKYLLMRRPGSFAISQISNPKLDALHFIDNVKVRKGILPLLRMNRVKMQLAQGLLMIFEAFCHKRVFKQDFEYYCSSSLQEEQQQQQQQQQHAPPLGMALLGNDQQRKVPKTIEKGREFLELHKIRESPPEVQVQDPALRYSNTISGLYHPILPIMATWPSQQLQSTFVFELLNEFSRAPFSNAAINTHGFPLLHHCKTKDLIFLSDAKWVKSNIFTEPNEQAAENNSIREEFRSLQHSYPPPSNPHHAAQNRAKQGFFMQATSTQIYFKNLNHDSTKPPLHANIQHSLLSSSSAQNNVLLTQVDENFVRQNPFQARIQSMYNLTYRMENYHPLTVATLDRFFKAPGELSLETQVSFSELLPEDSWRLYFSFTALEASHELLALYGLCTLLKSMATNGYQTEIKGLLASCLGGNVDSRTILLHYFPDGTFQGTKFV